MKNNYYFPLIFILINILMFGTALFLDKSRAIIRYWPYEIIGIFLLIIISFFYEFERKSLSSKNLTVISMLAGISSVLRVPFATLPGIQPCTTLVICTGLVFGPTAGFFVGALTPLVSNFFLGQGPWTPFQMIAWGLPGLFAGYLGGKKINIKLLMVFGIFWGYMYGWIMNIWHYAFFVKPHTIETLIQTYLLSFWWETSHAFANGMFIAVIGERTIKILSRYKKRFSIERI